MTEEEKELIETLSKCDFSHMQKYFLEKTEERKNMTKEEKQVRDASDFCPFTPNNPECI